MNKQKTITKGFAQAIHKSNAKYSVPNNLPISFNKNPKHYKGLPENKQSLFINIDIVLWFFCLVLYPAAKIICLFFGPPGIFTLIMCTGAIIHTFSIICNIYIKNNGRILAFIYAIYAAFLAKDYKYLLTICANILGWVGLNMFILSCLMNWVGITNKSFILYFLFRFCISPYLLLLNNILVILPLFAHIGKRKKKCNEYIKFSDIMEKTYMSLNLSALVGMFIGIWIGSEIRANYANHPLSRYDNILVCYINSPEDMNNNTPVHKAIRDIEQSNRDIVVHKEELQKAIDIINSRDPNGLDKFVDFFKKNPDYQFDIRQIVTLFPDNTMIPSENIREIVLTDTFSTIEYKKNFYHSQDICTVYRVSRGIYKPFTTRLRRDIFPPTELKLFSGDTYPMYTKKDHFVGKQGTWVRMCPSEPNWFKSNNDLSRVAIMDKSCKPLELPFIAVNVVSLNNSRLHPLCVVNRNNNYFQEESSPQTDRSDRSDRSDR